MKVVRVENPLLNSNTWMLEFDNETVWMVDAGGVSVLKVLPPNVVVKGILLTHAHYDHIGGVMAVLERYPDCIIYTNESGLLTLSSAKKNLSFYHQDAITIPSEYVKIIKDGTSLLLDNSVTANVFETPGHHPSSIVYSVNGYLFTGDSLIPGVPVVTKLPGGNRMQAAESVKRIKSLAINKIICPGHGPQIDWNET